MELGVGPAEIDGRSMASTAPELAVRRLAPMANVRRMSVLSPRGTGSAWSEFGARRKDGDWGEPPGDATELTVEVLPPTTTHVVKVAEVKRWLETTATDPAQSVAKSRLKRLLG